MRSPRLEFDKAAFEVGDFIFYLTVVEMSCCHWVLYLSQPSHGFMLSRGRSTLVHMLDFN